MTQPDQEQNPVALLVVEDDDLDFKAFQRSMKSLNLTNQDNSLAKALKMINEPGYIAR